jgi:mono/diheme cytochrome c family protein
LKRNASFAAAGAGIQLVPGSLRIWPGRVTPGVNRGYRTLDATARLTSMTAASGPVVYRGALFPEEFRGDGFVPEPSGNLIKRIKLTETGGTLKGANAYEGTEFLTSTDERFRPVNLYNGPDGALYVVDLYRGILQHKIYVTSFLRQQIDERGLDKGIHLGRIWRIVPEGAPKPNYRLTLARATPTELVAKLADPNGWVRDTAQRLLVEKRAGKSELIALVTGEKNPPLARVHALWTLEGTSGLTPEVLSAALRAADPRVRAAAVRLSEKFVGPALAAEPSRGTPTDSTSSPRASGGPTLLDHIASLAKTEMAPEVRLQIALTLGEVKTAAALQAMRALIVNAGNQPLLADAIVSGLAGRENDLIELFLRQSAVDQAGDVLRFATSAILKSANAARIERVLGIIGAEVTPEWARVPMLAGVRHFLPKSAEGRVFAGALPVEPKPLIALSERKSSPAAPIALQLLTQLKWPGKPGADKTDARPLTTEEQARFDKGRDLFAAVCAACHQPNGQGQPGLAPSLVYSRWVLGDPRVLARVVLNGKIQENLVMPPWKAALDDEGVASVLTFIRRSWGHDADPVTPPVVAEARLATKSRDEPFSDADLEELVQALGPPPRARGNRPPR